MEKLKIHKLISTLAKEKNVSEVTIQTRIKQGKVEQVELVGSGKQIGYIFWGDWLIRMKEKLIELINKII